MGTLLTIKEAAEFASRHIQKDVTPSNIAYLINYGRVPKIGTSGAVFVEQDDLVRYYQSYYGEREVSWKNALGDDLNWALSFDYLKESDTTKHVHRLHPYKGKFIPQLVEYFLDEHTDDFKRDVFFRRGDIVLDPFCGSGTTLVQAGELGIHAVGVDVSAFNTLISNVKTSSVQLPELHLHIIEITKALKKFVQDSHHLSFEAALQEYLNEYNTEFFPSPEFKIKVRTKEINEREYAQKHESIIKKRYNELVQEHSIQVLQGTSNQFLEKWYLQPVREEIDFVFEQIKSVSDASIKKVLTVILSRTIRSCRATTHADLATLIEPVIAPYYCAKHGKICKPLFSIVSWWERYSKDTIQRMSDYAKLRTESMQICLNGNSEDIDILMQLRKRKPELAELVNTQKIRGIFSSPPYVGLIDYHEQHAYAYDLFGFERKDEQEIGSMAKRQSKAAQQEYVRGVSNVLRNAKQYLAENYDVFLVANDKYNLYPAIAAQTGMSIVHQYKRPVLNRTEKDKAAYSEIIFHLKEQ